MEKSTFKCCIVSGLSGVGKTTLGKAFVEYQNKSNKGDKKNNNNCWIFIDQDTFFKKDKPSTTLSSGVVVKNWDCIEAIDWDKLNETVLNTLLFSNVLLVGFALWTSLLKFNVEKHICLQFTDNMDNIAYEHLEKCIDYIEKNIAFCCKSRQKSKGFITTDKIIKDQQMVREIVFPFYSQTLSKSNITNYITVLDKNDNRISANVLLKKLCNIIR